MNPYPLRIDRISRGMNAFSLLAALVLHIGCSEQPASPPVSTRGPEVVGTTNELPKQEALQDPLTPELELTPRPRYRGLWVLCEGSRRVLEDPQRVRELVEHARAMAVSDLFVQVYRGGRAWFDSSLADPGPYRAMLEAQGGDPLTELIEQAHAGGLRVHAWVNVLSLSHNRNAPIIKELGREVVHVDSRGRSILDYPPGLDLPEPDSQWYRAGTPGVYLDPGAPGVSERLVATFRELVSRYPGLDGLHLDYIRYPGVLPFVPGSRFGVGLDFGYGAATRERFRRETGLRGPFSDPQEPDPTRIVNSSRWDAWRREKVSRLVSEIAGMSESVHPGLRISAAVIPYVDRAYLSLGQDWRRWLEDGSVDFIVPMIYTTDDRLFRYQVASFGRSAHAERIWAGVGVWLFADAPGRARKQLEIARETDVAGDALFSYDSIADAPGSLEHPGLLSALSAAEGASGAD